MTQTTTSSRTLAIDGMSGDACVTKVKDALKRVQNVATRAVTVGSATIDADDAGCTAACSALGNAGYKAKSSGQSSSDTKSASGGSPDQSLRGKSPDQSTRGGSPDQSTRGGSPDQPRREPVASGGGSSGKPQQSSGEEHSEATRQAHGTGIGMAATDTRAPSPKGTPDQPTAEKRG